MQWLPCRQLLQCGLSGGALAAVAEIGVQRAGLAECMCRMAELKVDTNLWVEDAGCPSLHRGWQKDGAERFLRSLCANNIGLEHGMALVEGPGLIVRARELLIEVLQRKGTPEALHEVEAVGRELEIMRGAIEARRRAALERSRVWHCRGGRGGTLRSTQGGGGSRGRHRGGEGRGGARGREVADGGGAALGRHGGCGWRGTCGG
jgi:hypothetical protein